MKQRALVEEIKSQKKKLFGDLMLIKRFKLDLDECIAFASEPKHLKEAVAALSRGSRDAICSISELSRDVWRFGIHLNTSRFEHIWVSVAQHHCTRRTP